MKISKFGIPILLSSILVSSLFIYNRHSKQSEVDGHSHSSLPTSVDKQLDTENPNSNLSVSTISPPATTYDEQNEGSYNDTEKAQQAQMDQWQNAMLPPDFFVNGSYVAYDMPTLRQLSESGDVLAMQMLAFRLTEEGRDLQEAYVLWEQAVIHGAKCEALNQMANYRIFQLKALQQTSPDNQKLLDSKMIEALAYIKLAGLRGNSLLEASKEVTLAYDLGVKFSQETQSMAADKAREIYDGLQQTRLDRNLGNFDNFEPPFVVSQAQQFRELDFPQ